MISTAQQTRPPRKLHDAFSSALLEWYDRHQRRLPWRMRPGDKARGLHPDPYRVWLSEIMLQQTTVTAVKPYYEAFLEKWPDVVALASASDEDVMRAWAGLGYYSRARNLIKCARAVIEEHGGAFPDSEAALKTLPGIGDYTAAAIAAIAFERPAAVVDGNVERVITRQMALETPLPRAKPQIRALVAKALPADRPGDFAQAMMDLGATLCTPRKPACALCPVSSGCAAYHAGNAELFPLKAPKAAKPERRGAAFVAIRDDGAVFLRKRDEAGLLGGMSEVPSSQWNARRDGTTDRSDAPFPADWNRCGEIRHVFTHFSLELTVFRARISMESARRLDERGDEGWWSLPEALPQEALPSVIKKVVEAALPGATRKRPGKTGKGG